MKANQKNRCWTRPNGFPWASAGQVQERRRVTARKAKQNAYEGKQHPQSAPEFDIPIASIGCLALLPDG